MKIALLLVASCLTGSFCFAQRCDSYVSASDGWRPVVSAPHDGTVVEMAETFGIAPWFGLFKWTDEHLAHGPNGELMHFKSSKPSWISVNDPGSGVTEDSCLYWRPYKSDAKKYSDPTGGAQKSVKYWCDAMHLRYDPKKDACIPR